MKFNFEISVTSSNPFMDQFFKQVPPENMIPFLLEVFRYHRSRDLTDNEKEAAAMRKASVERIEQLLVSQKEAESK